MLGEMIGGRYRIIRYLGGGGFGRTYLAEDQHLPGRPQCVVKKLMPRVNEPRAFDVARRLFNREAEVLYVLGNHEHIPRLFAHFEENREFYLVQQYIEGTVLSKELRSGKERDEDWVIDLLTQILTILAFVHEQQVIHRDIKPSNLIRRKHDGAIVMIDFGGVKQIGIETTNSEMSSVTVAIGSSGYMPNEQLAGKPRFSSDIYAVGMVGLQALTGCYPSQMSEDLRTGEILWRDRAPYVSDALAETLNKMTRYDFRQRYQSVAEVLEALKQLPEQTLSKETIIEVSRHPLALPEPLNTQSLSLDVPLDTSSEFASQVSGSQEPPSVPSWSSQASLERISGHLAWYERADELFQQQRYQKAAECYQTVLRVTPDDYMVWFKLAMAQENCQHYPDALEAYTQVIRLNRDDYLAWFRRGKVLEQLYRYSEAIEAYDQVIRIQPDNYWAWHDRGRMLEASSTFDDALQSYDRAVQLKPDFDLATLSRKRLLQKLKRIDRLYHLQHYEEAIASCDRLIQANPDDAIAWLMRGMALENSKQYKAAIQSYNCVLRIQPDDHLAWFRRASLLEKLGLYMDAAKSYLQVTKLQPENCWAWSDRGRVLETIHQYEQALESYDQALRLRADFPSALEGRQRVLRQLQIARSQSPAKPPAPVPPRANV